MDKKPRPDVLYGYTPEIQTACGTMYITFNFNAEDNSLFEVFLHMGKAGGCANAQCTTIGYLVTFICRTGGQPSDIIHLLKGVSCHAVTEGHPSCADALAILLQKGVYDIESKSSIEISEELFERFNTILYKAKLTPIQDEKDTRRHIFFKGYKFIAIPVNPKAPESPSAIRAFRGLIDHVNKKEVNPDEVCDGDSDTASQAAE